MTNLSVERYTGAFVKTAKGEEVLKQILLSLESKPTLKTLIRRSRNRY
jgi:hypothetical protein